MVNFKVIKPWFVRQSLKNKTFFVINFFGCGLARALVLSTKQRKIFPYFGERNNVNQVNTVISEKQRRQVKQINHSVKYAARCTPWLSNCLAKALVVSFWCKIFRIPHIVYIGVAKSMDEPSGFSAHAWVIADSVYVAGEDVDLEYTVMTSFIYRPKLGT